MTVLLHRNCLEMCLVVKGHDGNCLQLENFWQIFSSFLYLVSQIKTVKTDFGKLFFQNSFDFASLGYLKPIKLFMYEQGPSNKE